MKERLLTKGALCTALGVIALGVTLYEYTQGNRDAAAACGILAITFFRAKDSLLGKRESKG